jgi:fluoroacetyl-CoA thioesterase
VTAVDGRRVSFQVEAWDEKEKIGEGTHARAIIDEKKFMDKVAQKSGQ